MAGDPFTRSILRVWGGRQAEVDGIAADGGARGPQGPAACVGSAACGEQPDEVADGVGEPYFDVNQNGKSWSRPCVEDRRRAPLWTSWPGGTWWPSRDTGGER